MGQPQDLITYTSTLTTPSINADTNWPADIEDMHTKFGVNPVIRNLSPEQLETFLKFRLDFLREELLEAYEAAGYTVTFDVKRNDQPLQADRAEDVVDAMVDLCVVAIGTMDAFDVDSYIAWNRVHGKNMQKNPGVNPNRPNQFNLPDLIKPEGWSAPSHSDNVGLLSKIFTA